MSSKIKPAQKQFGLGKLENTFATLPLETTIRQRYLSVSCVVKRQLLIIIMNKPIKKVCDFHIFMTEQLGAGKFAMVYKAYDTKNKIDCAAKIIQKSSGKIDAYEFTAISREIEIMKSLNSPNIIKLFDVHETAKNVYIFQELATQGTLRARLAQLPNKRPELPTALQLITGLLVGMAELVKHGVIHRDLKPENILISNDELKIADFGFSRISDSNGSNKTGVGTPLYMAPEVLKVMDEQTGSYDYKCDIWSFGVVCYEILTGFLPWKNTFTQMSDLIFQIKKVGEMKVLKFPPGVAVNQDLSDLLTGCIRSDPKERFTWSQIFNHKAFQGKFQSPNAQQACNWNFIIAQIRQNVHQNNIHLNNFLQKLPQQLTQEDLHHFLKALDSQIEKKQSEIFFQQIRSGAQFVATNALKQYFKAHKVLLKGLKISEPAEEHFLNKNKSLIERIKKNVQENQLDVLAVLRAHKSQPEKELLERANFQQALKQLALETVQPEQVDGLFEYFNPEHMKSVRIMDLFHKFCKVLQTPPINEDPALFKYIRALEQRKKN